MKIPWFPDPSNNNLPSVTLTFFSLTGISTLIACWLQSANIVSNISSFIELTITFACLYLGRRITYKGQQFSSALSEEITKKVETT
jgi:hypothetical protein